MIFERFFSFWKYDRAASWFRFFLYIGLMQFLVVSESNASEINKGRRFEDTLCLGVKFSQGQPLSDLAMVKDLGVKWVRDHVSWPQIEPHAGQYQPLPEDFALRLKFYRENDIGIVLLLAYGNPVAYPDSFFSPNESVSPEAYGRYAEHMARELKAAGVRFVLELWNEPHNNLVERFGGVWNGSPPSPWVDHYLKMVSEAVKRVKAFDPSIQLLTDDDMWVVHYHFLERGLSRELDGFAIHPYTKVPELTAVAYDTDWTRPYTVVDKDRSFESAMRRLREQGEKKLGRTPDLWITEWGWQVGEKGTQGPVSEEQIANYLQRAFILAASAGAKATCWFSAQDTVDGPMGLKDNNGRFRPAYFAFKQLSKTLGKSRYECELENGDQKNQRSFLFKDTQGWLVASWNTDYENGKDQKVIFRNVSEAPACK